MITTIIHKLNHWAGINGAITRGYVRCHCIRTRPCVAGPFWKRGGKATLPRWQILFYPVALWLLINWTCGSSYRFLAENHEIFNEIFNVDEWRLIRFPYSMAWCVLLPGIDALLLCIYIKYIYTKNDYILLKGQVGTDAPSANSQSLFTAWCRGKKIYIRRYYINKSHIFVLNQNPK